MEDYYASIDDMEAQARKKPRGSASIMVHGYRLIVAVYADGTMSYRWGNNRLSRDLAARILAWRF